MRLTILAIVAAAILSSGAAYMVAAPSSQVATVSASTAAQNGIIFSAQRVIELLKQIISLRATVSPSLPAPTATTTKPSATATTSASAAAPAKTPASIPPATVTPAKAAAAPATPAQSPTERALGLVLPKLRSALVNIVCLPKAAGGTLRGVSGSGIIIDSRGIILTVAHVAQYVLIAEARPDLMKCYVRTGSPATFAYRASPVYVSSNWIAQNAQTLSTADPRGTGEDDFALLAITASDTDVPLPASFPSIPLFSAASAIGDPVVLGSYGAEFLTSARIRSDLFPTLVYGTVQNRYTFHTDTIDLISLGGGAAAQQGSSGGGIANQYGQLVGLITTSSSGTDLATRDLHASTASYLQRAFKLESGSDMNTYLNASSISSLVTSYASQASRLATTLISANNIK